MTSDVNTNMMMTAQITIASTVSNRRMVFKYDVGNQRRQLPVVCSINTRFLEYTR